MMYFAYTTVRQVGYPPADVRIGIPHMSINRAVSLARKHNGYVLDEAHRFVFLNGKLFGEYAIMQGVRT